MKPKPKKRLHSQPRYSGLDRSRERRTSSGTKFGSAATKVYNTINGSNVKAAERTGKPQKKYSYQAMSAQRAKKK